MSAGMGNGRVKGDAGAGHLRSCVRKCARCCPLSFEVAAGASTGLLVVWRGVHRVAVSAAVVP